MTSDVDKKSSRRWWAISAIVAVALVGVIAYTTIYVLTYSRVPSGYETTEGVVVDRYREGSESFLFSIVEFEVSGTTYRVEQTGSAPGIGDVVDIAYAPDDPEGTATTSYGRNDRVGTALVVGLIVAGILTYWLVLSVRYARAGGPRDMTIDLPPRVDE